uniref:Putative LOC100900964 [Metaseiulus occidentalis] n=1 Tax=Lepeophtheirus salmonis TaxID=72036 RepID=A0A0K2UR90_LEPSM
MEYPSRNRLVPGENNVINADRKNILRPLHIKVGVMKQFVKALHHNGECFQHFSLNDEKKKERIRIFEKPQIRTLFRDKLSLRGCPLSNLERGLHLLIWCRVFMEQEKRQL